MTLACDRDGAAARPYPGSSPEVDVNHAGQNIGTTPSGKGLVGVDQAGLPRPSSSRWGEALDARARHCPSPPVLAPLSQGQWTREPPFWRTSSARQRVFILGRPNGADAGSVADLRRHGAVGAMPRSRRATSVVVAAGLLVCSRVVCGVPSASDGPGSATGVQDAFREARAAVSALLGVNLATRLIMASESPQVAQPAAAGPPSHAAPAFYDGASDTVVLDDALFGHMTRTSGSRGGRLAVAAALRVVLSHELIHAAQRAQLTAGGVGPGSNPQALDMACEGHAKMVMEHHAEVLGLDRDALRLVSPPRRLNSGFSCLRDSVRNVRLYATYELSGEVAEACAAAGRRDILSVVAAIEPLHRGLFVPSRRAMELAADSTKAGQSLRAALSQVACSAAEQPPGAVETSVVAMSAAEVAALFCPSTIRMFAGDAEVQWAILVAARPPTAPHAPTAELFLAELDSAAAAAEFSKASSSFAEASGLLVRDDRPSPDSSFRATNYPRAGVHLCFRVQGPYACGVFGRATHTSEGTRLDLVSRALSGARALADSHPAQKEECGQ